MPTKRLSQPFARAHSASASTVSMESLPPMSEHDVDVVGVHDIDEAFEVGVVASLEFVAAGPECG